jgi:di/tricarboxylate transporter
VGALSDITILLAIIAAVVVLFAWDRLPVVIVCIGCAFALWATGILTLNQALAGFGDPATIFVASLLVASAGLEKTGLTAWAGRQLMTLAGDSRPRLVTLVMAFCAVLSALITVNGAVAALLPVIVVLAMQVGRPPSKLLMPLVFGAHAGSMLALTGTPVNVLILDASVEAGFGGFGYFEYALVGVPPLAGCIAIAVLLGEHLLPVRESASIPPDLSRHARTLVEQFGLTEGVSRLRAHAASPLAGQRRGRLDLSGWPGLALISTEAARGRGGSGWTAGDVLVLRGEDSAVAAFAEAQGLTPCDAAPPRPLENSLFGREAGVAEVMVPPRSPLIGQRSFPGMVTESGDLIVLSVQRAGETLERSTELRAGDTVLLQGTWEALDQRLAAPEVLVVNAPDTVRRQAAPMGTPARNMILVMAAMVILLATGMVPAAVAGLLAAAAVLLLGILSLDELYRSIAWTTVILVGALMPLSTAITTTGGAAILADALIAALGDADPRLFLAGLFVLTAVLGQIISNTATALIVIPISVAASLELGLSPQPVLMCVAIAAAGAFLTPVATPTNLMVMEPAGYRFTDYWKFGLPLMLWFFIVAVLLVPLIWRF